MIISLPYAVATEKPSAKEISNRLKNLDKKAEISQIQTFDLIGTVSEKQRKRIDSKKKELQNDAGLKVNLDIQKSNITTIERTRKRLKRDIIEWTANIEYTEIKEIKKGIEDALVIAEEDHLNVEKLTHIYNLTKKAIRNAQFRSAGSTMEDKLQNLDLDRAETDKRLKELEAKKALLLAQIKDSSSNSFWTQKSLELEFSGVEAEILQHRLNIRHEDISKPMTIMMDGLLSLGISLNRWTENGRQAIKQAGLDNHEFDRNAPIEMMENFTLKFITLGFEGEALAAEAAAARQKYRKNLYKRSGIAFIRALISARDQREMCSVEEMIVKTVIYNGRKIKSLGCPDPMVENLKTYLNAIRKFQGSEADRAISEAEQLVAEQQIIVDFIAALPLVGESLDIYSVYAGENLAGVKLSGLERTAMSVLVVLPMVGPHALQQVLESDALKRNIAKQAIEHDASKKSMVEIMVTFFNHVAEVADDLVGAGTTIKNEISEAVKKHAADQMGIDVRQLKEMLGLVEEAPWVLDDAARARMKLFKTMRDAADDRIAAQILRGSKHLKEVYETALQRSQGLLDDGLRRSQGSGAYKSFMPAKHQKAFSKVAKKQRRVIVMRPVGEDAAKVLNDNFAATKGLDIKPKSANWGPQRAFIPVDQNFSKLGNPSVDFKIDMKKIKEFNAKAHACLKEIPPCANTTKLRIPIEGEADLVDVVIVSKKGKGRTPVYRKKTGELIDPKGMRQIDPSELDSKAIEHMEVFADADGNPLTADYDLLAVGSTREAQLPSASSGAGFDIDTASQTPRGAGDKGTLSTEIDEVVDDLNRAAREEGGYTQGKLVHHGPDAFNPSTEGVFTASEMADDLALTVFDPDFGELAIPQCDVDYMKKWCEFTGMCKPERICPKGVTVGCIPVDPDRILKDYFHNARLRGIDINPHSSWKWGNYNAAGGWTQTSFLGMPSDAVESLSKSNLKQLQEYWEKQISSSIYRRISELGKPSADGRN